MGTSGGEPRTLLNALKPMLGTTGDIRTPDDVVRMISLMRDAEKLMSRCIYINILKATISQTQENRKSTATLDKFLSIGGWNILNKWLMEAKKAENFPVVIELLEVLKSLPVTIQFLKQGNTGKLVKHLTKLDNPEIKRMASDILKQWMSLVRQTQPATSDKSKVNGASESVENNSDLLENSRDSKAGKVANSEGVKAGKRSRESSAELSRSPQPEKKTKTLSEVKINISAKQISKTKLIPPQPKPVAMESTGFMNALASATVATPARKRKRTTAAKTSTTPSTITTTANSTTTTTKPAFTGILDEILSSQSQTHGLEDKEAEKEKSKDKESKDSNNKDSSTPTGSPQPADSAPSGDASDFSNDTESKAKDNSPENTPPASVDSTQSTSADDSSSQTGEQPNKKTKKAKRVTWAEDHKLTKFHYFDLDEEERIVVRHPVNFLDAAHNEMVRERQLVEQAKRLSEDRMCERISWYRPKMAAVLHERPNHEPGSKSEQYQIQKDRESSILADLYLSKSSLPDSPAEPDPPVVNKTPEGEPKIIPHDEKGTTHLPVKTGPQETQPPPQSTSAVQLPPALASLFSGGAGAGASGSSPNSSAQPGSSHQAVTVDSLLDKLMKGSSGGQPSVLSKLLASTQQAAKPQGPPSDNQGSNLPQSLKNILEPLQNKMGGQQGPGPQPGIGLLGPAPGPGAAPLMMGPPGPGQFGPRGPTGPPMRPEQHPGFQGPGGPRQGPPMGPRFPGPEGMGPQHRGPMQHRMPGPNRGRGGPTGPRPLMPELQSQDYYSDESYDEGEYIDEDQGENMGGGMPPQGRGGRGGRRGRGRGGMGPGPGQMMPFRGRGGSGPRGRGAPPICRHFVSARGCLRGETCHFLHPGVNCPPPT